jgi:hypothetical protein
MISAEDARRCSGPQLEGPGLGPPKLSACGSNRLFSCKRSKRSWLGHAACSSAPVWMPRQVVVPNHGYDNLIKSSASTSVSLSSAHTHLNHN